MYPEQLKSGLRLRNLAQLFKAAVTQYGDDYSALQFQQLYKPLCFGLSALDYRFANNQQSIQAADIQNNPLLQKLFTGFDEALPDFMRYHHSHDVTMNGPADPRLETRETSIIVPAVAPAA